MVVMVMIGALIIFIIGFVYSCIVGRGSTMRAISKSKDVFTDTLIICIIYLFICKLIFNY